MEVSNLELLKALDDEADLHDVSAGVVASFG